MESMDIKIIQALISFSFGSIIANLNIDKLIADTNPIIKWITDIGGAAFMLIGLFILVESYRLKRQKRKQIQEERRKNNKLC